MSSNDVIRVHAKTFKVYYGCIEQNVTKKDLIGQGKTLEEAVEIARKYSKELEKEGGFTPEYGIQII